MKKTNHLKAVRCSPEEDLNVFLKNFSIKLRYDESYGLIIFFPPEVEYYNYFSIGKDLIFISIEIAGNTYSFSRL